MEEQQQQYSTKNTFERRNPQLQDEENKIPEECEEPSHQQQPPPPPTHGTGGFCGSAAASSTNDTPVGTTLFEGDDTNMDSRLKKYYCAFVLVFLASVAVGCMVMFHRQVRHHQDHQEEELYRKECAYGGVCYLRPIDYQAFNYEDAKKYCEDITMDGKDDWTLASIHTQAQNNVVTALLHNGDYSGNGWIGLTDKNNEGMFVWEDGTGNVWGARSMWSQYWADGEPNNAGWMGEDCVEVTTSGTWNDLPCSFTRIPVCSVK